MSLWCCAMERGKRLKSTYLARIQGDVQPLALRLRPAAVIANCLRGLSILKHLEVPERTEDGLLLIWRTGICPLRARALAIRGATNWQARQFLAVSNPTSFGLPTVPFSNPRLNFSVCCFHSFCGELAVRNFSAFSVFPE